MKLYLAPNAVVQPKPNAVVQKSIQLILEWWNNFLDSLDRSPFRKEKKTLQPPKLANNLDLSIDDASLDEN